MKKWTEKDIDKLKHLYSMHKSFDEIAKELGRTKSSVEHKSSKLKLKDMYGSREYKRGEKLTIDCIIELWKRKILPKLIATENGCLEWHKSNSKGYGQIRISLAGNSKVISTHRIAAMVKEKRLLSVSECVCHKCDNPSCCNPEHLFVGTQSDNMRDANKKGRMRGTFQKGQKPVYVAKGEECKNSKLTDDDVRKMREKYQQGIIGHKRLAKMFGVSSRTAYCVIKGITWKHIDDKEQLMIR